MYALVKNMLPITNGLNRDDRVTFVSYSSGISPDSFPQVWNISGFEINL